jgi:uncharacterized protein YdiU (UPF0061 family)
MVDTIHRPPVWSVGSQLGDGRAISLLETTSELGGRQEIQVKGAGRTPFFDRPTDWRSCAPVCASTLVLRVS